MRNSPTVEQRRRDHLTRRTLVSPSLYPCAGLQVKCGGGLVAAIGQALLCYADGSRWPSCWNKKNSDLLLWEENGYSAAFQMIQITAQQTC